EVLACDLHPDYYATRFARQMREGSGGSPTLFSVQHHHAHIVSCMAENGLTGDVIGLAMDGSGYGTDGHVWGGEFLVANERTFTRMGHLKEFPLHGGEKAIREPWRIAISLLRQARGLAWRETAEIFRVIPDGTNAELLERMIDHGVNSPPTSSLGRFLDGVAALLGVRRTVTFEGQAAMELEGMARKGPQKLLPFTITKGEMIHLDFAPTVRALVEIMVSGVPLGAPIFALHRTVTRAFRDMAIEIRERTGLNRVCLSGGCFQNRLLLEGALWELRDAGFLPFHHRLVPTNDGGLSLGQAVCAASRMQAGDSARPIIPSVNFHPKEADQ
ncbi:MAG: Kae1-like domain-containing protein, partial [Syntrophales bacterium]